MNTLYIGTRTRTLACSAMALVGFGIASSPAYALGIFGTPLDMSASVKETLLPSGTVVLNDSPAPLFDVLPGDQVQLLDLSSKGVNGSGRSTQIQSAFGSALAKADGNGGVGVSQLLFSGPDSSGQNTVRQLSAQSLWTQTFLYTGTFPIDITLHLHFPELQVGLLGVAPNRSSPSSTETAEAFASVSSVITHPDLTQLEGKKFEYGMREKELQFFLGPGNYENFADVEFFDQTGLVISTGPTFSADPFDPACSLPAATYDYDLGTLHTGDILSWVYTLTAEGTTHGFEHGYFAFFGDPFTGDAFTDNLSVTITPVDDGTGSVAVPEASAASLILLGFAGLMWRRMPKSRT